MSSSTLPAYIRREVATIATNAGFIDYTIEQNAGSKHGDGFVATMISLKISGNRKGDDTVVRADTLNLICKTLPESQARRDLLDGPLIFERECYMYTTVLPMFKKFQQEKGLTDAANDFHQFPNCYYACSNKAANEHVIIMDDLRAAGYELWDKLTPMKLENVKLLWTALGRFHGLSFALRDQRPEVFAEIPAKIPDLMTIFLDDVPAFEKIFSDCLAQAIQLLTEDGQHADELRYLESVTGTWTDAIRMCTRQDVAGRFNVIGHGDCWNNNMMFRNGNEEICLLDWQVSRICSPALDLSYFLTSSTDRELRDRHLPALMRLYYDELARTIRACGSDADRLFRFEDLQDQMVQFGVFGLTTAPSLLSIIVSRPENIVVMEEFAEQSVNGEPTQPWVKFDDESRKVFITRLCDVINDAKKYGWIK